MRAASGWMLGAVLMAASFGCSDDDDPSLLWAEWYCSRTRQCEGITGDSAACVSWSHTYDDCTARDAPALHQAERAFWECSLADCALHRAWNEYRESGGEMPTACRAEREEFEAQWEADETVGRACVERADGS